MSIAVAGISVVALLYMALLPMLFQQLIGLPDSIKMMLSIFLIAPLAFFMGMPFPIGLNRIANSVPDFIPWAWGINGFASVMSLLGGVFLVHRSEGVQANVEGNKHRFHSQITDAR